MLLALNASESVEWEELQIKVDYSARGVPLLTSVDVQGSALASHLAKPLGQFRHVLAPVTSNGLTSSSSTRLA